MTNPPRRYPTAKDFCQSITQRIKTQAARNGRPANELRRESVNNVLRRVRLSTDLAVCVGVGDGCGAGVGLVSVHRVVGGC